MPHIMKINNKGCVMTRLLIKSFILVLCLSLFCETANADMEAVNPFTELFVGSPAEDAKLLNDQKDVVEKIKSIGTSGYSKIKDLKEKSQDADGEKSSGWLNRIKDVLVNKKRGKYSPEETGVEAKEKTKETYSRKKGEKNNIAKQKELNKMIDKQKFDSVSTLFARSMSMRLALKEEKTDEPDLSTIALAKTAISRKKINIMKRYNRILGTQTYVNELNHTIEIQNYQIEEEEE